MKRIKPTWAYGLTALATIGLLGSHALWAAPPEAAPTETTVQAAPVKELPFAKEIAAFEAKDKEAMPPTGGVLFIGSSSIRLWSTLAQDFPELPVINRGFGGSQIADSIRYADRIVLPYKPKLVIFFAGGNDINAGKTPEKVAEDFHAFADKVQKELPATTVAFISINPSRARWDQETKILETNSLIEKYISETNSPTHKRAYINSHTGLLGADGQPQENLLRQDKLHLNTYGYKAWVALVRPRILELATEAGVERLPAQ